MPITFYRVSPGATRPDRIQVDPLMRHRQHFSYRGSKQVSGMGIAADALVERLAGPSFLSCPPAHRALFPWRLNHPPTSLYVMTTHKINGTANFRTLGAMTTTSARLSKSFSPASASYAYDKYIYICMYVHLSMYI